MSRLHLSSFNELSFTQTCLSQWYDICVHIRSTFLSFFCLDFFECFFVFKTLTRWSWSLLTKPASSSSKEQDSSPTYQVVLHILWQSCRPRSASHALCPPCFIKNILPTPPSKLYLAHLALHLLLQPLKLPGPLLQAAPTPSTLPHDHMIIHMVIIAPLKRS